MLPPKLVDGNCSMEAPVNATGPLWTTGFIYTFVMAISSSLNIFTNGLSLIVFILNRREKLKVMRRSLFCLSLSEVLFHIGTLIFILCLIRLLYLPPTLPISVVGALVIVQSIGWFLLNTFLTTRNWCVVMIASCRALAICQPLKSRMRPIFTARRVIFIFAFFVISSSLCTVPRVFEFTYTVCLRSPAQVSHIELLSVLDSNEHYRLYYKVFGTFAMQTILPICCIIFMSIVILVSLKRSIYLSWRQQWAATRMVIVLLSTFIACELPVFVMFCLRNFFPGILSPTFQQHALHLPNLAISLDSFANLFIYVMTMPSFRLTLRRLCVPGTQSGVYAGTTSWAESRLANCENSLVITAHYSVKRASSVRSLDRKSQNRHTVRFDLTTIKRR